MRFLLAMGSIFAGGVVILGGCTSDNSNSGGVPFSIPDGGGGTVPSGPTPDGGATPTDGGTPNPDGGGEAGVPTQCTYTTTGSVATSGTCSMRAAADTSKNQLAFSFTGSANQVSFGGGEQGTTTLTAGTFTLTQVPEAGGTFLDGTTSLYAMCNNNECSDGKSQKVPNQGTFTLTISDPGAATANILWQSPHGSLHMILPADPETTASGTVTLDATF